MALLLALSIALPVAATETPDKMLANIYRHHEDVTRFRVMKIMAQRFKLKRS